MTLAAKPIPRVLSRHNLLLGGERDLVMLSAIANLGVAVSSMNIPAAVVCATLWSLSLWAARKAAKHDPQLSDVYKRALKYRGYYPNASRPHRDK